MWVTQERNLTVAIDIDTLARNYFYFDKPVVYKIKDKSIDISPVNLTDSEIFLSSIDIFNIDKNSSSSPEVISMSYLQFIGGLVLNNEKARMKFVNILNLCLGFTKPRFITDKDKLVLTDDEKQIEIRAKQFEDIRRIILYQNLPHFDDTYINPEAKQAMAQVDAIKNQGLEVPTVERKIAIITAHSGLPKREQLEMTYRSHTLLYEEVCGEVEFTTVRPVALFSGKGDKFDHWIHKKSKNKFEDYFVSDKQYNRSMGGNGEMNAIQSTPNQAVGQSYSQQFNSFKK